MPTPKNGTTMLLYVEGVAVAMATDVTLRFNRAEIDVTTKSSAAWKQILPGVRDWSIDSTHLVAFDATLGMKEVYALDGTQQSIKLTTATSTEDYWHGEVYLTGLEVGAPMEDKITFSCAFTGTGALVCSTKT